MLSLRRIFVFAGLLLFAGALCTTTRAELLMQDYYNQAKNGSAPDLMQQVTAGGITNPDGISAVSKKNLLGKNSNGNFGYSVSGAGDVNGDGNTDVIVGEYNYSSGNGRAYIYFGPISNNSVTLVLSPSGSGENFGFSVSSAGDVNGDGFSDVIVGAKNFGTNAGKAYIYYGGISMDNTADVILTGEATGDLFGTSVAQAYDVNSDGFGDVIVGAPGNSSGRGKAYIYYGGSTMNTVVDVTLTGETTGDAFGCSVSGAGDVDRDGYNDVIVGANNYSSATGRAYIYLGGASMNSVSDVVMTGEATSNNFGTSVSLAGDVNGDSYDDVIVGASGYSSNKGRAYVYLGGASMNNTADVTLTGETNGDLFGTAVSFAGDFLEDGYSDVAVGAPGYSTNTGRVYEYNGGPTMNSIMDNYTTGEATANYFGRSVGYVGDCDGEGTEQIIAGGYGYTSSRGMAAVFKYTLSTDGDLVMTGEATNSYFGGAAMVGDVNGDGYDDLLVGAQNYNSNTGRAYLFFGGAIPDNVADVTFTGEATSNSFGAVSAAGDVNGDGFKDIIIGAPAYSTGTGRAYLYYGGSSMDNVADVTFTGEATNNSLGNSVAGGDLNGDGYSDLIIGAQGYSSFAGRVYIYFGGSTMNNVVDVTYSGPATSRAGSKVACIGDVNGDTYQDVLIGQYFTNQAIILLGGSSMDNVSDLTITGETASTSFALSMSGAGDVNLDGYDDFVIGATGFNTNSGKVYVYYGGQFVNNIADVTMLGETTSQFGSSMTKCGDLNQDGYPDILIGATAFNSNAGKAYIYYGGKNMDGTADRFLIPVASGAVLFGNVAGGGDFNADGLSDFMIGAGGFNTNTGRLYVYLNSPSTPTAPRITAVNDVPYDDGGKVKLTWLRSGRDVLGTTNISTYVIERSLPAGTSGYAWEQVANITARGNSRYSYTCLLPNDSAGGNATKYFFRITATTTDPALYYRSNILSGYSVDNLVPAQVLAFRGQPSGNNIVFNWKANTEKDLAGYYVYTSANSVINPDTLTPVAVTRDTFAVVTAPSQGYYYYFIRARDVNKNFGALSSSSNNPLPVELESFRAAVNGRSVELHWVTATEINMASYIVERKTGSAGEWIRIGEVKASGTSNSGVNYNFTDRTVESGKYFYRLAMQETNGFIQYSRVAEADMGLPADYSLKQNYPNPFNPATTIQYSLPVQASVKLEVYDSKGMLVAVPVNANMAAGNYVSEINGSSLSSGVYFYRLTVVSASEGKVLFTQQRKMMLLK